MKRLASVLFACAACGGGGGDNGHKDASTIDVGEPDAPSADDVTVRVRQDGAAEEGATVVFQDRDGGTIKIVATDATGVAVAAMPLGGAVTVIQPGPVPHLFSWLGVTKGDQLELGGPAVTDSAINVSFPADPAATNYDVHVLCGVGGAKSTVSTTVSGLAVTGCDGSGDVLVLSRNDGGAFLNAMFVKDVSIDNGQTAVLTGSFSPIQTESFSYTHADLYVGGDALRLHAKQVTGNGALLESFASPIVTGGNATFSSLSAKASAAGAPGLRDAVISAGNISTSSFQRVVDLGNPTTTYALDVSTATLPAYTLVPSFDASAHSITWTATGGSVTPDATIGDITITRSGETWDWTVVGAYVDGSAAFPTLPADAGGGMDLNPTATDTIQIQRAELISIAGGYDGLRRTVFAPTLDLLENFGFDIKATTTGRIITADFSNDFNDD